MAHSLNEVTLLGNLGKDPEMRYTASGQAVTQFSIATSRSWKPKDSDEWQEETEWSRIVVWGDVAEQAAERLRKGHKVLVKGRLQTRSWDDVKTGVKRYVTEIVAERLVFIEKRDGVAGGPGAKAVDDYIDTQAAAGQAPTRNDTPPVAAAVGAAPEQPAFDADAFDDLPF